MIRFKTHIDFYVWTEASSQC